MAGQVLVEDLIRLRGVGRLIDNVIGLVQRSRVQRDEARRKFRTLHAAVTRIARHGLPTAEVGVIDLFRHQQHAARRQLQRRVFRVQRPIGGAVQHVALAASSSDRRRNDAHRSHELIHGNAFEHLDVFEHVLGHRCP
jgi:hypothetical protein